ncbi:MAG: VWA domain-containing protein [Polyangiaceae bacterium]|nr:VWA domain-containing protein [Polyangiaceae bacterium]
MNRPRKITWHLFVSLTLTWTAAAWWGCAEPSPPDGTPWQTSSSSSSSGEGGAGGEGGGLTVGGAGGTGGDAGACATTKAESRRIPVDIVFLIDRSGSMGGAKWEGTKSALNTFFNDPASAGISAGMVYFPAQKPDVCNPASYSTLDVPISVLPANAFELTNSIPFYPLGSSTPTWPALKGTLAAATAYQDSHPGHKVIVVLATDGDPTGCQPLEIDLIAALATSARNYNGVRTYVIGVAGSTIANLDKIAEAGGTTKAYDITKDISEFAATIAEIRKETLACDFELPAPPDGMELVPDIVNFTYTPNGMGEPKIVPRADDLADCKDLPGWYYDSNLAPTKLILCPASCATVQADVNAKVEVLFGCDSVLN